MINKDINGTTLSQTYIDTVKSDNRDFLVRLMMNGIELSCGVKRCEITKGSVSDTTQFKIGSVIGSSVIVEVLDLNDDVKGETIEVQVGLDVSGSTIWINVGQFIISEVKKTIYGSTLTGFGKLVANSGGTFTEPATKSIANIGTQIGIELGCSIWWDSAIDRTPVITESLNGMTTYQVIQLVAQLIGGYAIDRPDGSVLFELFNDTPNGTADSGMMNTLPDMAEQDFEITGIQCIVKEASSDSQGDIPAEGYTQGSPINYSFNNTFMTQTIFTNLANNLIGYKYRPGNINLSLGDPRIEGWDIIEVTDADSSVYVVPCHQVRHIYDGGFRTEIIAVAATHLENDIGTVSPLQQQKKDTDQKFVEVEAEIENLADGIQYFWHDNDGAHVCTVGEYRYNNLPVNTSCLEVLITSTDIIFRKVTQTSGGKTYEVYSTYASSGITLGDYASMTNSGIILGDINNTDYQLKLDPAQGLLMNDNFIIVSDYATQAVTEATTTTRICAGFMNGDSNAITFTVPLECIIPEGTSVDISVLWANFKIDGTSYFVDGAYFAGGYTWLNPNTYSVSAQVVGTSMTLTLTKKNTTFKNHGTSTAVTPYSAITCEIDRLTWSTTPLSRSLNRSMKSETTEATEPPEVIEK